MVIPRLSHNIMALAAVQAGNLLVPMLALPYLARVLGAESYGQVVWVQTIMLFGTIWIDFGFGWSATRAISTHRNNPSYVAHLFADTWAVQWVLAVLFAVATLISVCAFVEVNSTLHLYLVGLGIVFGQVLLPMWLFQGLEALREIAIIQLLGKLVTLPLVFFWVTDARDVLGAMMFFSASALITGGASLAWIYHRQLVRMVKPEFGGMRRALLSGAMLFSSRALISLYTTLVPLAVGYWAGATQLGYFNLADKLRTVVQTLLAPVSQALFPRMSWLFQNDASRAYDLARKFGVGLTVVSGLAGLILIVSADSLMVLLGGADFSHGSDVLRWLAFVPAVVVLSNLMGVQIMLPRGLNQPFTIILALASVLSLLGLYPMVNHGQAIGAAQLVFAVECFVTGSMAVYLWWLGPFAE